MKTWGQPLFRGIFCLAFLAFLAVPFVFPDFAMLLGGAMRNACEGRERLISSKFPPETCSASLGRWPMID